MKQNKDGELKLRDRSLNFIGLNHKDIGARIRAERLRQSISQEQLAELAELSNTYMSHIENGKTKLSLAAMHRIAWALGVTIDELACDSIAKAKDVYEGEIHRETKDCDETEIRIIADMIKAIKVSLRKRIQKPTD